MAPLLGGQAHRNPKSAASRTPYDRPVPRGISKPRDQVLAESINAEATPNRSLTGSIKGSLGRVFRSIWSSGAKSERPIVEPPRLLEEDEHENLQTQVDPTPEPIHSLQWAQNAPPQFDLTTLTNISRTTGADISSHANLIVSAYREALMNSTNTSRISRSYLRNESRDVSTLSRFDDQQHPPMPSSDLDTLIDRSKVKRDASPPASKRPIKVPKVDRTTLTIPRLRTHRGTQRNPNSASSYRTLEPVRDHGRRIQLVTRPVVDLRTLPETRKEHPGFISANFDVSDDEDRDSDKNQQSVASSTPAAPLTRRPATESDRTVHIRAKAPTDLSSAPRRVLSLSSKRSEPESQDEQSGNKLDTKPRDKAEDPVSTEKPVFSFGSSTASKEPAGTLPAPLFGTESKKRGASFSTQSSEPTDNGKPVFPGESSAAFSFKPSSEAPKQPSSESPPSESKPAFSFSSSSNTAPSTAFQFGGSSGPEKPTFSFGSSSASSKDAAAQLTENPSDKHTANTSLAFGATGKPNEKPMFSFGGNDKPSEKPTFSFGSATGTDKPSAESNKSEPLKSAFSFGNGGIDSETGGSGKAFGFGSTTEKATEKTGSTTPAFSFGGSSGSKDQPAVPNPGEKSKPAFTFGDSSQKDKPAFTFGDSAQKDKPAFSLGDAAQKDKPFTFGNSSVIPSAEPKDAAKPAFSFGASTTDNAAAKPVFSFGGASTNEPKNEATPTFSFGGASASNSNNDSKPGFSFGGTSNEKKDEPKPVFSLGSSTTSDQKDEPKSAFSFGTPSAAPNGDTAPKTTGFSFGANTSAPLAPQTAPLPSAEKPAFSFGANSGASTTTGVGSAFNFGSNPASGSATPSFGFGASSNPVAGATAAAPTTMNPSNGFAFGANSATSSRQSTPSFNFGGNTSSAPSAPGFPTLPPMPAGAAGTPFGSGMGTTPAFGSATPGLGGVPPGRKIAQPRRRLARR